MKKAAASKPQRLRIIGGRWRGRVIEGPASDTVRPTANRLRESLFNRLLHGAAGSGVRLAGARIADVFAGTGAMGLEALSRGAAQATLVERDPAALALIRRNIGALHAEDLTLVVSADAAALPRPPGLHDIAFLDAPYRRGLAAAAMTSLARQGWLKDGALVCVETDAEEPEAELSNYAAIDRRVQGRAAMTLYLFRPV